MPDEKCDLATTQGYIHLARVRPEHAIAMNAVASHLFGSANVGVR